MSPQQQKEIVTQLCNSVRDKILARIDDCEIPEEWDGLELRQLFAEIAWSERTITRGGFGRMRPDIKRAKAYRNLVLVENLDR